MTELRLTGAKTIEQANAVPLDFLPRYNNQFAVPAEVSKPVYRPWDGIRLLDEFLCFKHTWNMARDNTVKYEWRTLQLLPAQDRPSYAAVHVEGLEHTDGRLPVCLEDGSIPSRPAPPRPGALRASHGALAPTPEISRIVKRLANHRLRQPQLRNLSNLEPDPVAGDDSYVGGGERETRPQQDRPLLPRQLALWKAVHDGKVQGLSQHGPETCSCPHTTYGPPPQPWRKASTPIDRQTV